MKKLAESILLLLISLSISASVPVFEQRIQSVETTLRESLGLPTGPATQFVRFYIPGEGYFLVLTTDFHMSGRTTRTPFGGGRPTRPNTFPRRKHVLQIMKQALALFHRTPLPNPVRKGERMHLILIHRQLFRNPFSTTSKPVAFKVWVPLSALKQDADPLPEMRTD